MKKGAGTGKLDRSGREIKVGDTIKSQRYSNEDKKYQEFSGRVDFKGGSFGIWIGHDWWPFSELEGYIFEIVSSS